MTLMLDLTPEVHNRLQEEATRNGVAPEDYARLLLEERLLNGPPLTAGDNASAEERKRRLSQWIESNRGLPTLPEIAFQRANFYEEPGS